jgi:hypothetical protein
MCIIIMQQILGIRDKQGMRGSFEMTRQQQEQQHGYGRRQHGITHCSYLSMISVLMLVIVPALVCGSHVRQGIGRGSLYSGETTSESADSDADSYSTYSYQASGLHRRLETAVDWKQRFANATVQEVQATMQKWGVMGSDPAMVNEALADISISTEENNGGRGAASLSRYDSSKDTAFFFMIPKSGTTTLGYYLSHCVTNGMVMANAAGPKILAEQQRLSNEADADRISTSVPTQLEVVERHNGQKYINIDVTTRDGLDLAGELGLAESAMADVLVSASVVQVASIFNPQHQAHMFLLMRHPIQRVLSEFYYVQIAEWEPQSYKPWLKDWTLEQYVVADFYVDNFVTRQLVGKLSTRAALNAKDLDQAKHLIDTKCLIGLTMEYKESLRRFQHYFGWQHNQTCVDDVFTHKENANPNPYTSKFPKGSPEHTAIAETNRFDIEVWRHAYQVFQQQGQLFPSLE